MASLRMTKKVQPAAGWGDRGRPRKDAADQKSWNELRNVSTTGQRPDPFLRRFAEEDITPFQIGTSGEGQ